MLLEAEKRNMISLLLAVTYGAENICFTEKLDHENFEVIRTVSFDINKVHKKLLLQDIRGMLLDDGIPLTRDYGLYLSFNGVIQFHEDGLRIYSKAGIESIIAAGELDANGVFKITNSTKRFYIVMKYEQSEKV